MPAFGTSSKAVDAYLPRGTGHAANSKLIIKDCGNHARPSQNLRLCRGQARVSGLHNGRARGTERGELWRIEARQVCLPKRTWRLAGLHHDALHTGRVPDHARESNFIFWATTDLSRTRLGLLTHRIAQQGQTEKLVQEFGRDHKEVEVQIVRPGVVLSTINTWRTLQASMIRASSCITSAVANIDRAELSAALLDQVMHGFEKDILSNADLVRIGGSVGASKTQTGQM